MMGTVAFCLLAAGSMEDRTPDVSSKGETKPPVVSDIKGWKGTVWGMTESQVRSSVKDQFTDRNIKDLREQPGGHRWYEPFATYAIEAQEVCQVNFYFQRGTKRLDAVYLVVQSSEGKENVTGSDVLYEKIVGNIVTEYGEPNSRRERKGDFISKDAIWIFPSSVLDVNYFAVPQDNQPDSLPIYSITFYSPAAWAYSEKEYQEAGRLAHS